MSRAERWAAAAIGLVLVGCMRIYPDPELPDIRVEWFTGAEECAGDTDRVVVSLAAIDAADPAAELDRVTAPCAEGSARFDDVERLRYRVTLRLEDANGDVLGGHTEEIDLRDGLSERVVAFFGRSTTPRFRVAWIFDMAASCASLSATQVVLRVVPDAGPAYFFSAPCDVGVVLQAVPDSGTHTLVAHATTDQAVVVATSPVSAPFTVVRGEIVELGTITLSPCGDACPRM